MNLINIKYLFILIFSYIYILGINYIMKIFEISTISTVNIMLINHLLFLLLGLILGIKNFYINFKKKGKWKIDNSRLLYLVLPILIYCLLIYSPWFLHFKCYSFFKLIFSQEFMNKIIFTSLGYFIITSFYKIYE